MLKRIHMYINCIFLIKMSNKKKKKKEFLSSLAHGYTERALLVSAHA